MGVSDGANPDLYKRQSIVLIPTGTQGLRVVRPMTIMGYDDAPEGEWRTQDSVSRNFTNQLLSSDRPL